MANPSIYAAFERMWQHVVAAIGNKAEKADLNAHTSSTNIHITSAERTNWNAAKTTADYAQTRADSAYELAESKVDSLSDLGITATATELNYVDGVTSNVQTQIDDIHTEIDAKMNAVNPSGVGSFNLNRKAGTTVGDYSFTEGYDTTASGHVSHAEGDTTTASGNFSHTEGARTTASGAWSHAEGYWSTASGQYSHAEGYSTIAASNGQHAQGKFNIEDNQNKYAHIVGNGTSSKRANIHTLDWDGNAWFEGDIYIGGTSQDDTTASKVVTEASISTHVSNAFENIDNLAYINEEDIATSTNTINADTLGGYLPSNFALDARVDDLQSQINRKADVTKLTPRNLLDNSDFTNPVNQRGFISTNEDSLYTIDRWVTNSADNAATVSLDSSGMTIAKNNADYGGIYQNFERYTAMYGKTYTAAICVNGIWECVTFVIGKGSGGTMFPISGIQLFSVEWAQVLLRNYSDTPITIQRVALYEGEYTIDTLPEYQPKGYANELLACNVADTGNVTGMELLWENASPASVFGEQTISISELSEYENFYIEGFETTANLAVTIPLRVARGKVGFLNVVTNIMKYRQVNFNTDNTIQFSAGNKVTTFPNPTVDNSLCIPYKIYGVK